MNWTKDFLKISFAIVILLFGIELSVLYLLNYKQVTAGNSCKQYISEYDFSVYRANCDFFHKHWEQDTGVEYLFNEFGRRDGAQSSGEKLIAFIGDSFTFGAMVDIDSNYNYRSLHYIGNEEIGGHNYGVSGEQFHNVVNKLENQDFSIYENIVYGLTPNDLFDLLFNAVATRETNDDAKIQVTNEDPKSNVNLFRNIKIALTSTATSKFLLHNLMSIDSVYLKTYLSRQPYAGYLESPISDKFEVAINSAFFMLSKLEKDIKAKLMIVLLPQRAEVVAKRLALHQQDFNDYFIKSCKRHALKCFSIDIEPLSKIDESHFPIDGHLTKEGNDIVGRQVAEFLMMQNLN